MTERAYVGRMRSTARRVLAPLTIVSCLVGAGSAQAATFTVTNTGVAGTGSLTKAITDSNGASGADTINFNIAGAGPHEIAMGDTQLPDITGPVTIDGFSQHDSSPNTNGLEAGSNAVMKIVVSGKYGINLAASASTITGLVVNAGTSEAVFSVIKSAGSNNVIAGNYIGTNAAGTAAVDGPGSGFLVGVELAGNAGNTNNTIGGSTAAARNVIAGEINEGIRLNDNYNQGSTNTKIQGNYIGTLASGIAAPTVQRMVEGVRVFGGNTGTAIGGAAAGQGNLISGMQVSGSSTGIRVETSVPGSSTGTIQGNLIGTQRNGVSPLGNSVTGVLILNAREWVVGGSNAGEGNVIAFNGFLGVQVKGTTDANGQGDHNRISGNSIHDNGGFGIDLSLTQNQADVDINDSIPRVPTRTWRQRGAELPGAQLGDRVFGHRVDQWVAADQSGHDLPGGVLRQHVV